MRPISLIVFVLAAFVAFGAQAAHHEQAEAAEAPAQEAAAAEEATEEAGEADEAAAMQIGDCAAPQAPVVPDGATAAVADIKAAADAVRAFVAAGEEYTACLDRHEAALSDGEDLSEEDAIVYVHAHNTMVDAMQKTAADFNTSLGAYKERRAAEKAAESAAE